MGIRYWALWFLSIIIVCTHVVPLHALSRRSQLERKRSKRKKGTFKLTSPAFEPGDNIPPLYTCDGQNISPELQWQHAPMGTQSFVLICHDPDDALAGVKIQWIVYDIPSSLSALPQRINVAAINAKLGTNSWGRAIYEGPCPPLLVHRYFFTLYALDIPNLPVEGVPEEKQVTNTMKGHIIGKAVLLGRYQRTKSTLTKAREHELHTVV